MHTSHTSFTDLDSGTSSTPLTDERRTAQGLSLALESTRAAAAANALAEGWQAQLHLGFARRRGSSVLAHTAHEGPLRVQRAFFPEGPEGPCHVYVLHPPGGIVSGDRLLVDVRLEPHTRALLTAPGANKLYRARAQESASLVQRFRAEHGAIVEWLPPETIAFSATRASVCTEVELAADACYAGWEILCLGRPAAGEQFEQGELKTELRVQRAGKLVYFERGRYVGGDALLDAPWGLQGQPVLATFLVASPRAEQHWVERVREALSERENEGGRFAVTLVSGILIARYLGSSTREARVLFERAYQVLRPLYAGLAAVHPRIWST